MTVGRGTEGHDHCQKCKVEREHGTEMRSLTLFSTLIFFQYLPLGTSNRLVWEAARAQSQDRKGRNGWRRFAVSGF